MAENQSPGTNNENANQARGVPYYEKLRKDLRETLSKKRQLDQTLANTEEAILKAETTYLEETTAGNIIKGFDNYIKGATVGPTGGGMGGTGGGTASRRRAGYTDADRLFSNSSTSASRDSPPPPTSETTTPSHAPTPTSSFPTSARESNHATPNSGGAQKAPTNNKKKKATDKDDDDDGKPAAKRGKITYGRE